MLVILILLFCGGCKAELTEKDQQKLYFVKAETEVEDKTPEERAATIENRLKQIKEIENFLK